MAASIHDVAVPASSTPTKETAPLNTTNDMPVISTSPPKELEPPYLTAKVNRLSLSGQARLRGDVQAQLWNPSQPATSELQGVMLRFN